MLKNCFEFETVWQLKQFLAGLPDESLVRGSSNPILKIRVMDDKEIEEKVIIFDDVIEDDMYYENIMGSECYDDSIEEKQNGWTD